MVNVNLVAVLVSGIICMFIGFLWYGPLFGKLWMRLTNMTDKQMKEAKKKGMGKSYFVMFIGTLVMSYVLAMFIKFTGSTTFAQGMITGFWVWLGFMATKSLSIILWEGKPVKLYFLNVFHDLVVLLIIGGVLAVWV